MNPDIIITVIGIVGLSVNCASMFLTFPRKHGLRFSIGMLVLFTAAFYAFTSLTNILGIELSGLRGLVYLPVMLWLLRGQLFQKIFAFFLQYILTVFQSSLVSAVITLFIPRGSDGYYIIYFIVLLIVYAGYITLVFKFGRHIFQRLFMKGRTTEWILYSFGAVFAYAVLTALRIASISGFLYILLLMFVFWSFGILCFAIINTHEKSKQRYEAEFARNVISSGREHYQKMDEMYDTLRILRHDYKYHLNTIRKLLHSGNLDEAEKYLTGVETRLSDHELLNFCKNSVINALLASYAERCTKLDIRYDATISLPETVSVPNYEMCIILGNLLENAVETCQKQKAGRRIELVIKPQGAQLAIMVKNGFDGRIPEDGGQPVSTKKDGGLGLRSVQAVADRYGGELLTEWDGGMFTAYVLIRL